MTQEAASFVIWKPEHDGHAPPNWREGMKWGVGNLPPKDCHSDPSWGVDNVYTVPAEALNSPHDDESGVVDTWKQDDAVEGYNSALIEKAVKSLRQYPAEELAKHGITLAPEKDWATELWADTFEVFGRRREADLIRSGQIDEPNRKAIALIRERVVLKEGV